MKLESAGLIKKINIFLILFLINIAIFSQENNEITLNVGVLDNFPPQYDLTDEGLPQGFAIDFIEAIVNLSGFKINYVIKSTWQELSTALESGEIDLIPNSGITQRRLDVYSYSIPIETFNVNIFTRKSYPQLFGLNDLEGKIVGVVEENIGEVLIQEVETASVHKFLAAEDALFDLLSGNIDAFIYPAPVFLLMVREAHLEDHIKENGPPLVEIKRGISVLKGNEWILEIINPVTSEFIHSKEYQRIYTKWYGRSTPFWNIKRVIIAMSIIMVITIIIVLLWKYKTTEQIVKKRTEELLFKGSLLENIAEGVITIDLEKKITSWNSGAETLFGYRENDILDNFFEVLFEKTDCSFDSYLKKIEKTKSEKVDLKYIQKDSNVFEGLTSITKLFDAKEVHIGYIIIIQDITNRKKMEAALQSSEARFKTAFYTSPDAVNINRLKDGLYIDVNQGFTRLTGYTWDDVNGKTSSDINIWLDPLDREELIRGLKETGYYSNLEAKFTKKDGTFTTALMSARIIDIEGVEHILSITRDITELKNMQKNLQQAQKMESIGLLAGGIAHDFNNILSPILGYVELTLDHLTEDSEGHNYLNKVLQATERARDLIKQILTFSRKNEHDPKPYQCQPIIKEALKLVRSSIPTTIEIQQDIASDCGLIIVDPIHIHQIIMNLCTNAYHAMEESGGILSVALEELQITNNDSDTQEMTPGSYICLKVRDTGQGIEQKIVDHIFDPYFTTKPVGKGSGMGLSIIYGIVKEYDGYINVFSEPGKGTEFKIYIPIIDAKKNIINSENNIPLEKGNERILLVDDEDALVQVEKKILEQYGYHVTTQKNSLEALELFRSKPNDFDLIISDVTMPHLTGDRLALEIIKIRKDIPILLCTGFSNILSNEKLKNIGIKGLLMKPISKKELILKVREVIDL
jgi:PAS domain S-box-containing protein